MSEIVKIVKQDKNKVELASFDYELPTEFEELEIIPGKDRALKMVRNQMKIEARASKDPRKEHKVREPGLAKLVKEFKEEGFSVEDLKEFIRIKRQ